MTPPPRTPPDPAALRRLQQTAAVVIGLPALVAVITTLAELWPATLAIRWLAHDDGRYGVKAAIMVTWLLQLLVVLAALVPLVVVVNLVRRRRR